MEGNRESIRERRQRGKKLFSAQFSLQMSNDDFLVFHINLQLCK